MTQEPSYSTGYASQRRSLPLVVTLVLGLLLSLFHCTTCGPAFASSGSATIVANLNTTSSPDSPSEQQLPAHSGHCLNHVAAPSCAVTPVPAELIQQTFVIGSDQSPVSLAGLPLFKPPRA